jgi:hypothetical protein
MSPAIGKRSCGMSTRNPVPGKGRAAWRAVSALAFGLLAAASCDGRIGPVPERDGAGMRAAGAALHSYDPAAPELMRPRPAGMEAWTPGDIEREIRTRVEIEKSRRELEIPYYRIGYNLAFPLPLTSSPSMAELPAGIPGITYPWYTWLSWGLEERWRLFHVAWRRFGDLDAGARLQIELAALAGWDQYCESAGQASLSTAHLAGCLAQALSAREGWEPEKYSRARTAAETMLERELWPWISREWPEERETTARDLQNIRVIILVRAAELARVIESPRAAELESRAKAAQGAWIRYRLAKPPHSEGSAYDGFLMDSLTGWLGGLPDPQALLAEGRDAFAGLAADWVHLALPGRAEVAVPLGDVEPEMPFWMTALFRLARWHSLPEAAWLVRRLPAAGVPAAFLTEALENGSSLNRSSVPPRPGAREHPQALTLRTGWDRPDVLAAIGLTRNDMGHLHSDAGHLLLGWQGRWWITDPGYQQYRPGAEREFSLGVEAHNYPVISGRAQTRRAPRLAAQFRPEQVATSSGRLAAQFRPEQAATSSGRLAAQFRPEQAATSSGRLVSLFEDSEDGLRVVIDLSACYEGLPAGARIEREVRLLPGAAPIIIARDRVQGVGRDAEVRTSWQGGTGLAWAFRKGWARLSDGAHVLWIGVLPGAISAAALSRHEGSRGPLTLHDAAVLAEGQGDRYWIFACDSAGGWDPPVEKCLAVIRDWGKAGAPAPDARR